MQCVSGAQHFLTSIHHTGDGIPFDKITPVSLVNLLRPVCCEDFTSRDDFGSREEFLLEEFDFERAEHAAAAVGGKRAAAAAAVAGGKAGPTAAQPAKSRKTVSVADVRFRGRRTDGSSSSAASGGGTAAPATAGASGGRRRTTQRRAKASTPSRACPPARQAASRAGGTRLVLGPRASGARAIAPPPPPRALPPTRGTLTPRAPLYRAPLYRPPLYRPPPTPRPPTSTPWMSPYSSFYSPPSAAFSGCRTRFPVDSFEKHFSLWRHDLMRSRLVLLRCHARHLKAKSSTENLAEVAPPLDEDVASWVQVAPDGAEDWEAEREQYMETQRCIWSKLRDPSDPDAAPSAPASVVEYPVRDAPPEPCRRRPRAKAKKGRQGKAKSTCNVKGKIRAAAKSKLQAVAAAAAAAARMRWPPPLCMRPPIPPPPMRIPPPSARPKSRTTPVSAARSLVSVRGPRRIAPPTPRPRVARPAASAASLVGPPGSAPVSAGISARAAASRRSLMDARPRMPAHLTVRPRPSPRRWSPRAASEPPRRRPRRPRQRPRRQRPVSAASTCVNPSSDADD